LNAAHVSGKSDIVLIPQPTQAGSDPLRWSSAKKYYQLFLLALYACAFSFGENTLGAAWTTVSEETGVSLTNMNGGSALNYLLLGFVNIFWIPAAMKIGRRPVFLATTIICMCAGIWLGKFTGTGQWMMAMVLNGFGTSAYQAVIQLSVFDMFFTHERGRALSYYLFGQQLGSILGLISGGSIADGPGWRWSQYIVAIIDGTVFVLLLLTFEETLFPRFLFTKLSGILPVSSHQQAVETITPKDAANSLETSKTSETDSQPDLTTRFPKRTYVQKLRPWTFFPQDHTTYWQYFRRPFVLFTIPNIVIAGFIFAFGCTAGIVSFNTISAIMTEPPYGWSTTATGLLFFAALVGNIVGWMTGVLSDFVVIHLARKNNGIKEPEMRLWTLCLSFVYAAVGYQLYGWGAHYGMHWMTIGFGVGCMIAHQVSACSIATAYAMECFPGVSFSHIQPIPSQTGNHLTDNQNPIDLRRTRRRPSHLLLMHQLRHLVLGVPIHRGRRIRLHLSLFRLVRTCVHGHGDPHVHLRQELEKTCRAEVEVLVGRARELKFRMLHC
jgi:MFS family permease